MQMVEKTSKSSLFQVLLLNGTDNRPSNQKTKQPNTCTLKQHQQKDNTGYITSKPNQKTIPYTFQMQTSRNLKRKTLRLLFHEDLRRNKMCGVHP
jgi:CHAT domain-containing protein